MWLLLLAFSLQGFAAATMLNCGPNHHRMMVAASAEPDETHEHTAARQHHHEIGMDDGEHEVASANHTGEAPSLPHLDKLMKFKCNARAVCCTTPVSSTPASARAEPADPKAPVPAALYVSPLRACQGFAEPQVAPWRDTKELVRQRGGWRAYAREAREPDAPKPAERGASQPAPAAKPASGGHAGHEMK